MGLWQEAAIAAAAFAAGMINSIAGGGTLVSFPVLLWTGRDAVLANATSTVALWPASLAGVYGFRREFAEVGGRRDMLLLGVPSVAGGVLGAFLLLRTPPGVFARLVPFLILFATFLIMLQEPLSKRLRRAEGERPSRGWWSGAMLFQFAVGVYGGYFGAGIGILMLASLALLGFADIHRMNALKNLLAVFINGVAALYFVLAGAVIWGDVMVMTLAAIAGGYSGARLAYKLGRRFVRGAVIVIGLVMGLSLLFSGG